MSCRVEVKHFTVKEAKAGAGVGSADAAASALRAPSADWPPLHVFILPLLKGSSWHMKSESCFTPTKVNLTICSGREREQTIVQVKDVDERTSKRQGVPGCLLCGRGFLGRLLLLLPLVPLLGQQRNSRTVVRQCARAAVDEAPEGTRALAYELAVIYELHTLVA